MSNNDLTNSNYSTEPLMPTTLAVESPNSGSYSSSSKEQPLNDYCEDLLHKCSVSELYQHLSSIKAQVEEKKVELRSLVGERYRDLIDVADLITTMTVPLAQLNSISIDIDSPPKPIKKDDEQLQFYAFIVVLNQSITQITKCLDKHFILDAAYIYLISLRSHEYLVKHFSDNMLFSSFEHQIKIFNELLLSSRPRILEACHNLLQSSSDAESCVELLAVSVLLKEINIQDLLLHFLHLRQSFILNFFLSDSKDFANDVFFVCKLFRDSIHLSFTLFENEDLVGNLLSKVEKEKILRGFGPSLAIFTRYLPSAVLQISFHDRASVNSTVSYCHEQISKWVSHVMDELKQGFPRMLGSVSSASLLKDIRNKLWKDIKSSSFELINDRHSKILFGPNPVSLWDDLLAPSLALKSRTLVQRLFKDFLLNSQTLLLQSLAAIENFTAESVQTYDNFIWKLRDEQMFDLKRFQKQHTPDLILLVDTIDKQALDIINDLRNICNLDSGKSMNEQEIQDFINHVKNDCFESLKELANILENLDGNADENINKSLFIGRVAYLLLSDAEGIFYRLFNSPLMLDSNASRAVFSGGDERWVEIKKIMRQVGSKSFGKWSKTVAAQFSQKIKEYLQSVEYWQELGLILTLPPSIVTSGPWEQVSLQGGHDVLLIPAQPSAEFLQAIFGVVRCINQQGGHMLDRKEVLMPLANFLLTEFLETFASFTLNHDKISSLVTNERALFQLYFDFEFGWLLLQSGSFGSDLFRRYSSVKGSVKHLLDPIELSLVETELQKRVNFAFSRTKNLFFFLSQLNPSTADSLGSDASLFSKQHLNLMPSILPSLPASPTSPHSQQEHKPSNTQPSELVEDEDLTFYFAALSKKSNIPSKVRREGGSNQREGSFGKLATEIGSLASISSSLQSRFGMLGQYF